MKNYELAMDLLFGDYDQPFKITFIGEDNECYYVGYAPEEGLYGNYPDDVEDVTEFIVQVANVEIF